MDDIREAERDTEFLRAKNERAEQELNLAERKALIKRLKSEYGPDWKQMLGSAVKGIGKSLKVDKETMQTLHSMSVGGSELRNLSNPAFYRRHK